VGNPAKLLRIAYTSSVDLLERDFFLYTPKGFNNQTKEKWPLMLFLHGNGERGNGKDELDFVMTHGPLYEAWIQKRDLPFLIIAPQLPMFGMDKKDDYLKLRSRKSIPSRILNGVPARLTETFAAEIMTGALPLKKFPGQNHYPMGWEECEDDLLKIINLAISDYNADKQRIYLTGLSYGGFGTWYMASRHPKLFAAIAPVVAWGHPKLISPIAKHQIPVWNFAGGRDTIVEPKYFYTGLNKLESLGHKNLRFTIHADKGHDAYLSIYAGQDIYEWFLKHKIIAKA
jgi:predicted peptidase